jgi:Aldehyde dehydrogenase family
MIGKYSALLLVCSQQSPVCIVAISQGDGPQRTGSCFVERSARAWICSASEAAPGLSVDVASTNDTVYGLAAGIWTRDLSKAHRLAAQLRAGTVWINCYNVFDAALPFGGYKQSGWGREMGHEVLENYTEVKSVCIGL